MSNSSSKGTLAIASFVERPELRSDDRYLRDALERTGVKVVPAVWDDPTVEWGAVDGCLIRSVSDYHVKHRSFLEWLERIDRLVPTWNPVDMIEWNADKTHLRTLAESGVPIVPTHWIERGKELLLADIAETNGWREIVIKPTIGLAAQRLHRVRDPLKEGQDALKALLADYGVMVQPFLSSVERSGEVSLIYVGGELTHAVRKRPASGDFRVQGVWGGTSEVCQPSSEEVRIAGDVLDLVPGAPVFARIDLVEGPDGGPCLIELELIEPDLFFRDNPVAAHRLAANVSTMLR